MKLYEDEPIINQEEHDLKVLETHDLQTDIDTYDELIDITASKINAAYSDLRVTDSVIKKMEVSKLGTEAYHSFVETSNIYMSQIAKNLDIKYSMPAQEDFHNVYAAEACHSHVLENFKRFVKKIYDYIISLLKSFFSKVGLFLKRLVGADLQLDEYEKYMEKLIVTLKDKPTTTPNKRTLSSKLPKLLLSERYSHLSRTNVVERCNNVYNDLNDLMSGIMPNGFYHRLVNEVIKESKQVKNYFQSNKKVGLLNPGLQTELSNRITNFKNILIDSGFSIPLTISSLPDKVKDEVEGNLFGIDKDKIRVRALFDIDLDVPYKYNVYLAYVEGSDDERENNRLCVIPYIHKDSEAPLSIENLDDKKSIEMLYKSYKEHKNKFSNEKAEDSYRAIEKSLTEETGMISSILILATEAIVDRNNPYVSGLPNELEDDGSFEDLYSQDQGDLSGKSLGFLVRKDADQTQVIDNKEADEQELSEEEIQLINENHEAVRNFHRFMESYINALQMVARTMLVDLTGMRYTLRYEMVRYMYLCIKAY